MCIRDRNIPAVVKKIVLSIFLACGTRVTWDVTKVYATYPDIAVAQTKCAIQSATTVYTIMQQCGYREKTFKWCMKKNYMLNELKWFMQFKMFSPWPSCSNILTQWQSQILSNLWCAASTTSSENSPKAYNSVRFYGPSQGTRVLSNCPRYFNCQ